MENRLYFPFRRWFLWASSSSEYTKDPTSVLNDVNSAAFGRQWVWCYAINLFIDSAITHRHQGRIWVFIALEYSRYITTLCVSMHFVFYLHATEWVWTLMLPSPPKTTIFRDAKVIVLDQAWIDLATRRISGGWNWFAESSGCHIVVLPWQWAELTIKKSTICEKAI